MNPGDQLLYWHFESAGQGLEGFHLWHGLTGLDVPIANPRQTCGFRKFFLGSPAGVSQTA